MMSLTLEKPDIGMLRPMLVSGILKRRLESWRWYRKDSQAWGKYFTVRVVK